MPQLRRIVLVVFSAGWVVLVWGGAIGAGRQTLDLFRYYAGGGVGWPSAATGTSFPMEEFSFQLAAWQFTLGCAWLLVVIIYWVLWATRQTQPQRDA